MLMIKQVSEFRSEIGEFLDKPAGLCVCHKILFAFYTLKFCFTLNIQWKTVISSRIVCFYEAYLSRSVSKWTAFSSDVFLSQRPDFLILRDWSFRSIPIKP